MKHSGKAQERGPRGYKYALDTAYAAAGFKRQRVISIGS